MTQARSDGVVGVLVSPAAIQVRQGREVERNPLQAKKGCVRQRRDVSRSQKNKIRAATPDRSSRLRFLEHAKLMSAGTDALACWQPGPAMRTKLLPEERLGVARFRLHLRRRLLLGGQIQFPRGVRLGHSTLRMDASQQYDRCPQTGHLLLLTSTITGVGFFSLMTWYSLFQWAAATTRGRLVSPLLPTAQRVIPDRPCMSAL